MAKINRDDIQASLTDMQTEIPAGTVDERWNAFKSTVYKASKEKFGTAVRKHEDWFDWNSEELEELINHRNLARNNMLSNNTKSTKDNYRTYCQLLWQRCRELKNK